MNICIITSSYPLNENDAAAAAGVFVKDFAIELTKMNNKVFILTQSKEGKIEDNPNLNVIRFPWRGKNKRLSTLSLKKFDDLLDMGSVIFNGKKALFNLITSEKIDLIIAMWAVPCGAWAYLANRKFKIPYITWTLGSDIWVYGRKKSTKWIVKKILKNSFKLYSDGKELMVETSTISNKHCEFLPTTRVLPKSNLPSIKLYENKANYLYIGRYHPHKGIDILIESINLIPREEIVNMHFHIFGGGELEETIRLKVKEYELEEYVSINGYITPEYAAAYLKEVHALIIPSRIESIPVVLSDALQMECPVIATDVGDMGELLKKFSVGNLVKPCDLQSMKKAIIDMKYKERASFKENIKNLYKFFDLKQISKKIISTDIVNEIKK